MISWNYKSICTAIIVNQTQICCCISPHWLLVCAVSVTIAATGHSITSIRAVLSFLHTLSLLVSVDVKVYWTVLRHWSQLVPNMSSEDIKQHFTIYTPFLLPCHCQATLHGEAFILHRHSTKILTFAAVRPVVVACHLCLQLPLLWLIYSASTVVVVVLVQK